MAGAHQAPLSMELSRQEHWSGLLLFIPRHHPRDGTRSSRVSCMGRWALCHWCHPGSPYPPLLSLQVMIASTPTQSALLETWPPHSRGHKIMSIPPQKCLQNVTPPFSMTLVEIPTVSHQGWWQQSLWLLSFLPPQELILPLPGLILFQKVKSDVSFTNIHGTQWVPIWTQSKNSVPCHTRSVYMELFISTHIYSHMSPPSPIMNVAPF